MDDQTLEGLVHEYTEACKEKVRFLQDYAGPSGWPHKDMTPEARRLWEELENQEKEARRRMDGAFVNAIPSEWGR